METKKMPSGSVDEEQYKVYWDFGIEDEDMDLLLQLAFISPMSLNARRLTNPLADMLELVHPYHAGAFIVRGMRAESKKAYIEAADMFLLGVNAELRAQESAILCLNMLNSISYSDIDVADQLRDFLSQSERGQEYLENYDNTSI